MMLRRTRERRREEEKGGGRRRRRREEAPRRNYNTHMHMRMHAHTLVLFKVLLEVVLGKKGAAPATRFEQHSRAVNHQYSMGNTTTTTTTNTTNTTTNTTTTHLRKLSLVSSLCASNRFLAAREDLRLGRLELLAPSMALNCSKLSTQHNTAQHSTTKQKNNTPHLIHHHHHNNKESATNEVACCVPQRFCFFCRLVGLFSSSVCRFFVCLHLRCDTQRHLMKGKERQRQRQAQQHR